MNEVFIKDVVEPVIYNHKNLTKNSDYVKKQDVAKYWDKNYINQRIGHIRNTNHQMLARFLWMSGVRVSEAIEVRKKDIDFENHVIKLRWLKSRKYHHRTLPMHPVLRDFLLLYTGKLLKEDKLFPFTRQNAWSIIRKAFDGSPHMLRHSFAVNWLRQDGDIVILSRILGHSKLETTMEYLKIVPVDQGKELIKIQF